MTKRRPQVYDHLLESIDPLPDLPRTTGGDPAKAIAVAFHPPTAKPAPVWSWESEEQDGQVTLQVGKRSGKYVVRFPNLADFEVQRDPPAIACFPERAVPERTLRHLLLDQVMPRLLAHQGATVLHGSCVDLGAFTVGFLGDSGQGKSTLAAFFESRGFHLLSDDGFMLHPAEDGVACIPAYRGARLWDDSVQALRLPAPAEPMAHYASKSRLKLEPRDSENLHAPTPIRTVFLIDEPRERVTVESVRGPEAVLALLRHSFYLDESEGGMAAHHFERAASIASSPGFEVRRLAYPRTYDRLPEVLEAVVHPTRRA